MSLFLNTYYLSTLQEPQQSEDIQGIIEPSPVPFTFDTLGWKIVGLILLLILIRIAYKAYQRYQKNAYKRDAIKLISSLEKNTENVPFETVSTALKKVALISYGRETVAALYGLSWLAFLQEKGKNTPFMNYKDDLPDVIYSKKTLEKTKTEELLKLSKKWIKTHA